MPVPISVPVSVAVAKILTTLALKREYAACNASISPPASPSATLPVEEGDRMKKCKEGVSTMVRHDIGALSIFKLQPRFLLRCSAALCTLLEAAHKALTG